MTKELIEMPEGIYPDLPFDQYNKIDATRNSYLGKLNKCPAAALVEDKTTDAMSLGRAIHALVLEGQEAFDESCTVLPEINRRTNAGKAEFAQFQIDNVGKELIKPKDLEMIEAMKIAVYKHPAAQTVLEEGASEQTVVWKDNGTGLLCKCRPDRSPNPDTRTLVDLKSTVDAGEDAFLRAMIKYGYMRQGSFYLDGMNAHRKKDEWFTDFVFIAVEKEPPYKVGVYHMDEEMIKYGRGEYMRLLAIEFECRKNEFYPHYEHAGITTLFLPSWMQQ